MTLAIQAVSAQTTASTASNTGGIEPRLTKVDAGNWYAQAVSAVQNPEILLILAG